MPFITINVTPDLKQANRLLGRIAHVLECIAKEHFGLTLLEPAVPDEKDKTVVTYTTDEDEIKKELAKELELEEEPDTAL